MRYLFLTFLLLAGAHAQTPVTASTAAAAEAMARAERVVQEALQTYDYHYPDRPLWQEAIRAAREAVRLEPDTPDTQRLLAEVLSRANWYGPAWTAWEAYLATGRPLSASDAPLLADVGHELGYGAYSRGDLPNALRYYARVAELVPGDQEALVWAGRILLELGDPDAALPYWEQVAARDPTDARAQHFLQRARLQSAYGVQAADAFLEGVALYEAGQVQAAAAQFVAAARASETFTDAFVWAGRTLLESGQPANALPYWEAVAARDATDERAAYFLALTRDQLAWGPEAATAFREGVAAYEAGDLSAAATAFGAATSAQDTYAEAWAWRGRVAFERGGYADAARYYARASDLQPDNETYRYFQQEAERRAG